MDSKIIYLISKLDESLFKEKDDLDNYFQENEVLFFSYEKTFEGCDFYRLFTCNKRTLEVNYYFLNENFNLRVESYHKAKHITGALHNIDLRNVLSSNNRLMPESIKQRKNEICDYYKIFIEKMILERSLNIRKNKEIVLKVLDNMSEDNASGTTNNNNNHNSSTNTNRIEIEEKNKVIKI
jgi:hypothetical protein